MKSVLLKFLIYSFVFMAFVAMDTTLEDPVLNTPVLVSLAFLCTFLVMLYLIVKGSVWQTIFINLLSLFLIIMVFEKVLQVQEKRKDEANALVTVFSSGQSLFKPNSRTGYVHIPNYTGKAFGKVGDTILYDVTYHTDKNGCRLTQPVNPDSQSMLFLGCSFTFGFGLEDQQTLPWLVNDSLKQKLKVYNFGVNGYGPHQILSFLENGMVDTIVREKPKYCIYSAITSHAERVVNLYPWGYKDTDPKYALNADGKPEFTGPFADASSLTFSVESAVRDAALFKKILKKKSLSDYDLELFVAVVEACRDKIKDRYPDCEFHVIFWDDQYQQKEISERMIAMLKEKKINLHLMHNILPDYQTKAYQYVIYPRHEGHPNGLANQYIASYIRREIINNHNQLAYE